MNGLQIKYMFTESVKALLLTGDIPVKETKADLTEANVTYYPNGFEYTTEKVLEQYVDDANLTMSCMTVSESSLKKDWDNEDDDRWNSFLNKK